MAKNSEGHQEGPRPPAEAVDTVRHLIMAVLDGGPLSAREISGRVGISEKDVYRHLEHIRTSLHRSDRRLVIQPAVCARCGFVFAKRERLNKPGKCPVCRSESIHAALFSLNVENRK